MNYFFVGSVMSTIHSDISAAEYDTIGEKVVFSKEQYRDVVLGGAAFIPESDFNVIGFTAQELAAYGQAGIRNRPTMSFYDKLTRAQQVFRDIQNKMLQEEVATV